jgi:hypothetical protein
VFFAIVVGAVGLVDHDGGKGVVGSCQVQVNRAIVAAIVIVATIKHRQ